MTPVREYLSELRALWKLLRNRSNDVPLFAIIVLNSCCNGNCSYCYMADARRQNVELPYDLVTRLIDELAENDCIEVTFHGGEALLRDDLGSIIDCAWRAGLMTHLVTNGLLVAEKIDSLAHVDSVTVSLDGDRDFNDRVKAHPGYFERAGGAVRLLARRGIKTSINAILLPGSFDQIPFLCEFARAEGVGVQFLPDIRRIDKGSRAGGTYEDELTRSLDRILDFKRRGYPVITSEHALRTGLNWLRGEPRHRARKSYPCHAGSKSVIVDYDGRVYPCFSFRSGADVFIHNTPLVEAMKKARAAAPCDFCINFPYIDQSAILNLNLSVMADYARSVLRRLR